VASLAAHLPINAFVVDLHEIASEKKRRRKIKIQLAVKQKIQIRFSVHA